MKTVLDKKELEKREREIEKELHSFEAEERKKRNLKKEKIDHWLRPKEAGFYKSQRNSTTILLGGITRIHDYFVQGAIRGLGYKCQSLATPDNQSLRHGKEFCDRALCNPTYFTVGNLVKFLKKLRDEDGLSVDEINSKYVFLTAGSCGPCRFGMYEAQYRKALTDAGFDGFRVMTFSQKVESNKDNDGPGLKINVKFYIRLVKAFLAGDLLIAMGYRIRPYELNKGEADRVIDSAKEVFYKALVSGRGLTTSFWKVKKMFSKIRVNFLIPKPKVDVIGEFWAMTTDGDGNYNIHRWLEDEGAEVHVQKVVNWIQYIIYEGERWFTDRLKLDSYDKKGLANYSNPKKILRLVRFGKLLLKLHYYFYAKVFGLKGDKLYDMDAIAKEAHNHYHTNLSGGEGHMEVGKVIYSSKHNKCHMLLSVKPFGCMPSAGVSDGVQSRIQELYPDIIFYPIETTGDSAASIYSRVQMILFKAKKNAKKEFNNTLEELHISSKSLQGLVSKSKKHQSALYRSPHISPCTASNVAYDLIGKIKH